MPNCAIAVYLYVSSGIFVFLAATNCSFFAPGNNFSCICDGIMFPSLPVSILHGTVFKTTFDYVFRFAVITGMVAIKINGIYIHHINLIPFLPGQ